MFKPRNPYKPEPTGKAQEYAMEYRYGLRHDHGQFLNSMPTCEYRETGPYMDVKTPGKGGKRGS